MKTTKRQYTFLEKVSLNFKDEDFLFPNGMTDKEALDILCDYFLGEDWYTGRPVNHEQANVYRVSEIIGHNPKK